MNRIKMSITRKYIPDTESVAALNENATKKVIENFTTWKPSNNIAEKKFFNRRKCVDIDDWGIIGLNCTIEDIEIEHVEVVGFLSNWIDSYIYIISECISPTNKVRF